MQARLDIKPGLEFAYGLSRLSNEVETSKAYKDPASWAFAHLGKERCEEHIVSECKSADPDHEKLPQYIKAHPSVETDKCIAHPS